MYRENVLITAARERIDFARCVFARVRSYRVLHTALSILGAVFFANHPFIIHIYPPFLSPNILMDGRTIARAIYYNTILRVLVNFSRSAGMIPYI